jgi:hypothetical protein
LEYANNGREEVDTEEPFGRARAKTGRCYGEFLQNEKGIGPIYQRTKGFSAYNER